MQEQARQAHDDLLTLGEICVQFAGVERATCYPQNVHENDAEHSFHLAISATELAATYYPGLDTGLVTQFSIVHDLAEVYAGDTPSYRISAEDRAAKELTEAAAVERLLGELPPYTAQLLRRYEEQVEPEARFVRFVDKLLPAIIHAVATDANRELFLHTYGIKTLEELEVSSRKHTIRLKEMFPEFDFIHTLRELTSATSRQRLFYTER